MPEAKSLLEAFGNDSKRLAKGGFVTLGFAIVEPKTVVELTIFAHAKFSIHLGLD